MGRVKKLSDAEVRLLRSMYRQGHSQYELSLQFRVSQATVCKLIKGGYHAGYVRSVD
jgi:DNA-binding transcriptional regulator LsrR (DeoR family)